MHDDAGGDEPENDASWKGCSMRHASSNAVMFIEEILKYLDNRPLTIGLTSYGHVQYKRE